LFEEAELSLHGEAKIIRYCCVDLPWKPINDVIRFVCVIDGQALYILMSSDLELPGTQIVTICSYRFKIEVMFLCPQAPVGGFLLSLLDQQSPAVGKKQDFRLVQPHPSTTNQV
jgi:hypothetical protein